MIGFILGLVILLVCTLIYTPSISGIFVVRDQLSLAVPIWAVEVEIWAAVVNEFPAPNVEVRVGVRSIVPVSYTHLKLIISYKHPMP